MYPQENATILNTLSKEYKRSTPIQGCWAMNSTPVSLLERLHRSDDAEAWTRFVLLYAPMLYSWASRLGMQDADVADFVQEIFTVLLRRMPEFRYDPAFRFRSWLRMVAINHWRDRAKRRPIPQPIGSAGELDDLHSSDQLEQLIETEHNAFLMRRALDILKTDFKPITWQAFWQVAVDNRPAAEVGEAAWIDRRCGLCRQVSSADSITSRTGWVLSITTFLTKPLFFASGFRVEGRIVVRDHFFRGASHESDHRLSHCGRP